MCGGITSHSTPSPSRTSGLIPMRKSFNPDFLTRRLVKVIKPCQGNSSSRGGRPPERHAGKTWAFTAAIGCERQVAFNPAIETPHRVRAAGRRILTSELLRGTQTQKRALPGHGLLPCTRGSVGGTLYSADYPFSCRKRCATLLQPLHFRLGRGQTCGSPQQSTSTRRNPSKFFEWRQRLVTMLGQNGGAGPLLASRYLQTSLASAARL